MTAYRAWNLYWLIVTLASFVLLTAVAARAADFSVTDQDQANIAYLCDTAARSPAIPIEQVATIAQFCVQWKARAEAAKKQAQAPVAAEPTKE